MNNRRRQRRRLDRPRTIHFNEREVWNLNYALARVIAGGLRQFINAERHGYACDVTEEEWEHVLREMLWAFTEIAEDYPHDPCEKWFNAVYAELSADKNWRFQETERQPDGSYLVVKTNFPDTPQEVLDAQQAYADRVRAGVNLFAKYVFDLWD